MIVLFENIQLSNENTLHKLIKSAIAILFLEREFLICLI